MAIYARQTVEDQLQELQAVAQRQGWIITATFTDEGISGAKAATVAPASTLSSKGVARRDLEMIASWSVDRLGRSLPDLVGFLGDIRAKDIDLYLQQQGLGIEHQVQYVARPLSSVRVDESAEELRRGGVGSDDVPI